MVDLSTSHCSERAYFYLSSEEDLARASTLFRMRVWILARNSAGSSLLPARDSQGLLLCPFEGPRPALLWIWPTEVSGLLELPLSRVCLEAISLLPGFPLSPLCHSPRSSQLQLLPLHTQLPRSCIFSRASLLFSSQPRSSSPSPSWFVPRSHFPTPTNAPPTARHALAPPACSTHARNQATELWERHDSPLRGRPSLARQALQRRRTRPPSHPHPWTALPHRSFSPWGRYRRPQDQYVVVVVESQRSVRQRLANLTLVLS